MTITGAIIDLDGTVYRGDSVLPGIPAAIETVRSQTDALCFFSNNPIHDGADYVDRLQDLGIEARPGEACSSAVVTCEFLDAEHPEDRVYVIGSDGLRDHVRGTRATLTDAPEKADVLLASWTDSFGYSDMVAALRAVEEDTVFLGTDPDRTFPDESGALMPGSGAIIGAIGGVLDREPDQILGKPSAVAVEAALDRLGCQPSSCLVVGDRLDTDVAMGNQYGMTTVLVRSGVTDDAIVRRSDLQPDYVIDSLAEIQTVLDDLGRS